MSESFLGITAYFVQKRIHCTHHLTLTCLSFPPPHSPANVYEILDEVVADYNIATTDNSVIVTEHGWNMVAAFKNYDDDNDFEPSTFE